MSPSPSDQSWLYSAALFIYSSSVVRFVTATCFLISLAFLLPLVAFLILDLALWSWRIFWHRSPDEPGQPQDSQTSEPEVTQASSVSTKDEASGAQTARQR